MKKSMKRTLMGTALAGAVIIGAGAGVGTFSDFTDTAASNGNVINTGTLKLDSNTSNALFAASNLKPGATSQGTPITIKNAGSLPGKLTFDLSKLNVSGPNNPDDSDLEDIQVTLSVQLNGRTHSVTRPASAFKSDKEAGLEGVINGLFKDEIQPGQEVIINGSVNFIRDTNKNQNKLQGVNIKGNLSWTLTQAE